MQKVLFIGLGNPGQHYQHTRHNLGITALAQWVQQAAAQAESYQDWKRVGDVAHARVSLTNEQSASVAVHCIFPQTFMNRSGMAVRAYLQKENIPLEHIVLIHDDVELPLGTVRQTLGGSAKGHNGVRSVCEALATTTLTRLRLGVGRPPEGYPLDQYVLEKFSAIVLPAVQTMIDQACTILTTVARKDSTSPNS